MGRHGRIGGTVVHDVRLHRAGRHVGLRAPADAEDTGLMTVELRDKTVMVHPDLMTFADYAQRVGQKLAIPDDVLPDLLRPQHATAGYRDAGIYSPVSGD
jgi:hypothetical protein